MKIPQQKNIITVIAVSLILVAILAKRLFIKSYSMESTYSFLAGFATVLIAYLIFKRFFKKE